MANALTRAFDVIGEAALGIVVLVFILGFGAMLLADFDEDVTADYGNTSNAALVIDDGQAGLLDFSDNIDLVVLAIIFVIVLALIMLIKRQATGAQ